VKPAITLVVAVAENGVIGTGGTLPWHLPDDLKRFKALTLGKPTIMGRRTWESLPKRPLPGRTNIVITRDSNFHAEGAFVTHSVEEALTLAEREHPDEIMVIGGAEIFARLLPRADRIQWTEIMARPGGDAFMPPLDRAGWKEVAREGPFESKGLRYAYVVLERQSGEVEAGSP
jgi:dihydrofolate reductase